ncbi:hypothetical protein [Rhodopirellula bahusiensis]|uniref:hypothetical protein n=1 Tax=Rhodopirellula bahusiensis TaxID=2014065 RepID=UPI000C06C1C0|nr:hypothetical protein [Rhodopirellula bahusiensis]
MIPFLEVVSLTAHFEHHSDANQPLQIFFGKSVRFSHGDGECSSSQVLDKESFAAATLGQIALVANHRLEAYATFFRHLEH